MTRRTKKTPPAMLCAGITALLLTGCISTTPDIEEPMVEETSPPAAESAPEKLGLEVISERFFTGEYGNSAHIIEVKNITDDTVYAAGIHADYFDGSDQIFMLDSFFSTAAYRPGQVVTLVNTYLHGPEGMTPARAELTFNAQSRPTEARDSSGGLAIDELNLRPDTYGGGTVDGRVANTSDMMIFPSFEVGVLCYDAAGTMVAAEHEYGRSAVTHDTPVPFQVHLLTGQTVTTSEGFPVATVQ